MSLFLADNLETIRKQYIEVIENTENMSIYARWVYGQHPTDEMIQSYIDNQEMYMFMDGKNIAGMIAITMYQCEDYEDIQWGIDLKNDEVAVLHILAVSPAYQKKGVGRSMILEAIELAKQNGKKAIRLDALDSNIPAKHMYENMEFTYRGKKNLYAENTGWTDFLFYERTLNEIQLK